MTRWLWLIRLSLAGVSMKKKQTNFWLTWPCWAYIKVYDSITRHDQLRSITSNQLYINWKDKYKISNFQSRLLLILNWNYNTISKFLKFHFHSFIHLTYIYQLIAYYIAVLQFNICILIYFCFDTTYLHFVKQSQSTLVSVYNLLLSCTRSLFCIFDLRMSSKFSTSHIFSI